MGGKTRSEPPYGRVAQTQTWRKRGIFGPEVVPKFERNGQFAHCCGWGQPLPPRYLGGYLFNSLQQRELKFPSPAETRGRGPRLLVSSRAGFRRRPAPGILRHGRRR